MKIIAVIITIWLFSWNPFATFFRIVNLNEYNEEAKEYYRKHEFDKAIEKYDYMLTELKDTSNYTTYYKALAVYHSGDTATAKTIFQEIIKTDIGKKAKADAYFRLANIGLSVDLEKSITNYKTALRNHSNHLHAKLNLELALKLKMDQENQQGGEGDNKDNKDDKNKKEGKENKKGDNKDKNEDSKDDKKGDDEQNQQSQGEKDKNEGEKDKNEGEKDKQNPDGNEEKSEQQKEREKNEDIKEKLKEIKMTPEKAQQILEAMKNKEMQYIQSKQKRSKKRQDKNKPDW